MLGTKTSSAPASSAALSPQVIKSIEAHTQKQEAKKLREAAAELRMDELWEQQTPPWLIAQRCAEVLAARPPGPERASYAEGEWTWFGVAATAPNDMRGCCAPSSRPRRLSVVDDYDDDQASFDDIVRAYEEMYD